MLRSKKLVVLFALILVISIVTGCTRSNDTATTTKTTTTRSATTTASTTTTQIEETTESNMVGNMYKTGLPIVKESVTYKWMAIRSDQQPKELNDILLVKLWEEETGIDFQIEGLSAADSKERISLAIATNDLPDVFYGTIAPDLVRNGVNGLYLPVQDMIEKWSPNFMNFFEKRPDILSQITAPDGNIYGFPTYVDSGQHNTGGFYMNMDWLSEVGMEMPTTTDELLDVLRAFRNNRTLNQGEYPIGFLGPATGTYRVGTRNSNMHMFLWFGLPAYGVVYVDENGKVQSGFTHPGYKEGLKYVRTLYEENLMDPESYTQNGATYNAKAKEKKYGAFFSFALYAVFGLSEDPKEFKHELVPPPKGPNGESGWAWELTEPIPNGMVLTKVCENPEIMTRFADYLADELMSLQTWGGGPLEHNLIKQESGKYLPLHNNIVPWEHFLGLTLAILDREGFNKFESDLQGRYRVPRTEMYEPVVNKTAIFPNILATPEESTQISLLEADIMSYVNQMQAKFIYEGGIDDGWDSYVRQLNSMNLDRLISIYQNMYDRFKSKLN